MENSRLTTKTNYTAYIHAKLSPYRLLEDANNLIESLRGENAAFDRAVVEKALILINASELHPNMSNYQLSLARKSLADYFFDRGLFGDALTQYEKGLEQNPRLSVKKRIKKISGMKDSDRPITILPDLLADVLQYDEYIELLAQKKAEMDQLKAEAELRRKQMQAESGQPALWEMLGFQNESEYEAFRQKSISELKLKAQMEDAEYDPAFEELIDNTLAQLSGFDRSIEQEFRRLRANREITDPPGTMSKREMCVHDLISLIRSAFYYTDHPQDGEKIIAELCRKYGELYSSASPIYDFD